MARARAERARSKTAILEELSRGIERLQAFIPQIEDLGREGFPYLEGARARTELQLKECIRKTFGDKSPEYQNCRQHRLSMDSPADTRKSILLIRSLVASLEDKKLELRGLSSVPNEPGPRMTLVSPSTATASTTTAPEQPGPPPDAMPMAMTPTLDPKAPGPSATPVPTLHTQEAPAEQPHTTVPDPLRMTPAAAPSPRSSASPPSDPPHLSTDGAEAQTDREPAALVRRQTPPSAAEPARKPDWQPKAAPTIRDMLRDDPLEMVKSLCQRFHLVARQLRLRGEYRATLDVEDDTDTQDLLHALLRIYFDDIDTSEWIPSYSNGSPRTIFLLDDNRLAVLVKKTRTGLNARDIAEQLRIDLEHCRSLKRCTTMLSFIYDPEGRIGNPRGLEADLITVGDQLTLDVLIVPK
jgi:hypothetical protein